MTRRHAIPGMALGLVPLATEAQADQLGRVAVVGLRVTTIGADDPIVGTLRAEVARLRFVDGKNIRLVFRSAQCQMDRLPGLAEELHRLRVEIIVVADEVIR